MELMKGTLGGDNGEASAVNPSKRLATLRAASQVGPMQILKIGFQKAGPNQIRTSDLSDCSRLLYH